MVERKRILEALIESVLLYGCEAWTIDERMKRSLDTTEMWFLRRMMRIPWTAKKTNEVLTEAQTTTKKTSKICWSCHKKKPTRTFGNNRKI